MVKAPPRRSNHDYVFSLAGFLLLGLIVSATKPLLVPLALAVLLSFVLAPIVALLESVGMRRGPAVMIIVCLAFGAIGAIGWITGVQVQSLAAELPHHKREIRDKLDNLRSMHGGAIGDLLRMARELDAEPDQDDDPSAVNPPATTQVIVAAAPRESSLTRVVQAAAPVVQPLATAGLVIVLVLFMLTHREDLRDRMIGLLGQGRIAHTTRMFGATAERLSHYLLAQIIVNAGVGLAYAAVIWVIGAPFALLWGLLVALLRFVPFMGTWLAAACPLLLSVALFPGWGPAIAMFVAFVVINMLVGNFIEPLFVGRNTGVTPVALLIAAAFWTWIWGPIGLILSTPLTVCLVVLGQHVPRFRFLARLLGGRETFAPHVRFYQRLLAGDPREAQHCLDGEIATQGLESAYDRVVIPALELARRDRRRAALSTVEEESLYKAACSILEGCDSRMRDSAAPAVATGAAPTPGQSLDAPSPGSERALDPALDSSANFCDAATVVCCPAHHVSEELVARMLASVLDRSGFETRAATSRTLPADVLALVDSVSSPLLFISVLPPGGLPQARYLCKTVRQLHKDLPIVVGYWGNRKQFDSVLVSLRKAGASYVTTSLAQSRSQIEYLSRRKAASLSA
jgi:predicted PurR-regulated permease PerM